MGPEDGVAIQLMLALTFTMLQQFADLGAV